MQMKICNGCGIEKPINDFYADKYGLYGVRSKCKECDRKRHRDNYQNNKNNIIENNKKWKEKIKQEKTLPFWNLRARRVNERCQRYGLDDKITGQKLCDVFYMQNEKCFYCGSDLKDEFHVDHIIPISCSGANVIDNIAIACEFCNLHKSNNIFDEQKFFEYVKENYYRLRDKYETTDNPVGKT